MFETDIPATQNIDGYAANATVLLFSFLGKFRCFCLPQRCMVQLAGKRLDTSVRLKSVSNSLCWISFHCWLFLIPVNWLLRFKHYFLKDHLCGVKVPTANIVCCNTVTPVTGNQPLPEDLNLKIMKSKRHFFFQGKKFRFQPVPAISFRKSRCFAWKLRFILLSVCLQVGEGNELKSVWCSLGQT